MAKNSTAALQRIVFNTPVAGVARREQFEGREHLVIPVIALVEGVVNGVYVSSDELTASLPAWNGVPVTVNHPTVSGVPASANSPTILESQAIGRVFNAAMDGPKLKAEIWLDTAKATALGGKALEVLNRAIAAEPGEVSTGYFANLEETPGLFASKAFRGSHRNMRPDHLAMLPDQVGACSWADGCGAPRLNSQQEEGSGVMTKLAQAFSGLASLMGLRVNITNDDIREAIRSRLSEEYPNGCWVQDVMPGAFIYEVAGQLYQRSYSVDAAGKVSLGSDMAAVQRNTTYVALAANSKQPEESTMDKKAEKIAALIACNCTKFAEKDRPFLEGLAEEALDLLGVTPPAAPVVANTETAAPPEVKLPEGMALISNEQKAFLDKALAAEAEAKTTLVDKIVANSKLPKEYLVTQDVDVLRALDASLAPPVNYAGQAGFVPPVVNAVAGSLGPAPSIMGAVPDAK